MHSSRSLVAPSIVLFLCGCGGPVEVADVVYTSGRIYTVDEAQPWAEAVAIKDGRFLAVGSIADIGDLQGENTETVDLGGSFVMPGIIDLHVHPFMTPLFNVINLDFSDPTNVDTMLAELKGFAEEHPEKEWIRAGSYGLGVFPDENPSKELLDEVIPDRPVIVIDQTGHNYWVNSRALDRAGIDADTPTSDKYIIVKDPATGEPTGTLRESAMRLVEQVADWPSPEENAVAFKKVFDEFNSHGVTTMRTAEGQAPSLDVVKSMEDSGNLTMRLFVAWDWHMHITTPFTNEEMDQAIAGRGQYATEMVNPNFVKIFLDGTPIGYNSPFIEPYADDASQHGVGKFSTEELSQIVTNFDAQGIGVMMHSIGDGTARMGLDAIEAARAANGDTGVRHSVVHLGFVHPDDIPRFSSIPGVYGELSPAASYPMPGTIRFKAMLGEDRYARWLPAGSLLKANAIVGYGSDWLTLIPPSPWMPMQGFVTRENPDHPQLGAMHPDERITVEQAIRVFTLNGARAVGAEDRIGSIEVGKLADFIVLDRNLLEIEATDIRHTLVERTVLKGRVVYDRDRDPEPDLIDESEYAEAGRLVH